MPATSRRRSGAARRAPRSARASHGSTACAKVDRRELFGADAMPADALLAARRRARPMPAPASRSATSSRCAGAIRARPVLTAADVPGNRYGIYPTVKDQPVLADGQVRYRGEAVVALVGDRADGARHRDEELPITWTPRAAACSASTRRCAGRAAAARRPARQRPGARPRARAAMPARPSPTAAAVAEGEFETGFVEHAYIEPEAGYARRVGDRIEILACTQTPYMDRDEVANMMRLRPEAVRIIPTACGGGFGGKLDLSRAAADRARGLAAGPAGALRLYAAGIAWRPPPSAIPRRSAPGSAATPTASSWRCDFTAISTPAPMPPGARRSPTACRCMPSGPYAVPNARALARAIYTNDPPAGAFRGFGVPQAAIAHEALMDELAERLGIDRLEFRHLNALRAGETTATGQVLAQAPASRLPRGAAAALETGARGSRSLQRATAGPVRRGVGIGCMWYGIGNTSLPNPSTHAHRPDAGRHARRSISGAVDIGQGSNTVMTQIAADALGVPVDAFDLVTGDTDLTADAGKTSASRQTFVSGKAARTAPAGICASRSCASPMPARTPRCRSATARLIVRDGGEARAIDLARLPVDAWHVLRGATFDPPTTPLDANGQGIPYATYGFAAQMAEVEVDIELGTVKVLQDHRRP